MAKARGRSSCGKRKFMNGDDLSVNVPVKGSVPF